MIDRLKNIIRSCLNLLKLAWLFLSSLPIALKQRRRQIVLDAAEAERLDRIRNPSDYLGK